MKKKRKKNLEKMIEKQEKIVPTYVSENGKNGWRVVGRVGSDAGLRDCLAKSKNENAQTNKLKQVHKPKE